MPTLRLTCGMTSIPSAGAGRRHHPPAAHVNVVAGKGSWVSKILRIGSVWEKENVKEMAVGDNVGVNLGADRCLGCDECGVVGGEGEMEDERREKVEFDRESFCKLLRRVSMVEMEVYAKLSYLGRWAYSIPKIKPVNLFKYHGLRFVTSSLEKKAKSADAKKEKAPDIIKKPEEQPSNKGSDLDDCSHKAEDNEKQIENSNEISSSNAYHIAASAASFLYSRTKSILPFGMPKAKIDKNQSKSLSEDEGGISCSEMASFVATTNSVTAVVAGKEEMKQAVAKDLNSAKFSPCEWFICDDDESYTRYFVIQGSESLASWQANLLFEPIQFEGLDVLVHRGIYEAAKGIYGQMLPEVNAHLKARGDSAALRFTGHSLGGSLAMLVNLMLLIRGDAPKSTLLPVVTFGAPTIMCGGDDLLRKMGLPLSHVQSIVMHRDIVPRAFSCNYPDRIAQILKAVNGNFRNHPCLESQRLLYAPMGKLLILQPEEKFSPHHHLLPPSSGLYLLGHHSEVSNDSRNLLKAAQITFLNSPHPLEILSERSAYGAEGTVYRDHDMNAYLRAVLGVMRQEVHLIRMPRVEYERLLWSPQVSTQGTGAIIGQSASLTNPRQRQFSFVGVLNGGKETLKRIGRMVASRKLHMFVVILFPARLLVMGTLSMFPH